MYNSKRKYSGSKIVICIHSKYRVQTDLVVSNREMLMPFAYT